MELKTIEVKHFVPLVYLSWKKCVRSLAFKSTLVIHKQGVIYR